MHRRLQICIFWNEFTGERTKNSVRKFTCMSCRYTLQQFPSEEERLSPTTRAANVKRALKAVARQKDEISLRKNIERLWESPSQRHANTNIVRRGILQLVVKNRDLQSAMVLYKACIALKIPIGPKITNVLVKTTYATQHVSASRSLFSVLKTSASDVDTSTCNFLIKSFLQLGSWEDALSVLEWAEKESILPDTETYNFLITDSIKRGYSEKGEKLLMQMIKKNISRDEDSYISLLNLKAENGSLLELERTFRRIVADSVYVGTSSWNLLLKGYLKHANYFGVTRVLQSMLLSGQLPDGSSSSIIISNAYKFSLRAGGISHPLHGYVWERASPMELERLYTLLQENFGTNESAKHSMRTIRIKYKKLSSSLAQAQAQGTSNGSRIADSAIQLRVLMKAGEVSRSMDLFENMVKAGSTPPTQHIYGILLNGLLKYRKFGDAHKVLDAFRKTAALPSIVLQTILLDRSPSASAEHVRNSFMSIEKSGVTIDLVMFTCAAQKLLQGGELYSAVAMLSRALETMKMTIDMPAATVLLNLFKRLQRTEGIAWIVERILRDDVAVDKKFIDEFDKLIEQSEEPRQTDLELLRASLWSQYPS